MPKERRPTPPDLVGDSPAQELDSLNAKLRRKGPQEIRHVLEASIEADSRQRRDSEKPASLPHKN